MESKKKLNKKGSVQDVTLIIIILFALAMIFITGLFMVNTLDSNITPKLNAIIPSSGSNSLTQIKNVANNTFNTFYVLIFAALIMALMITAFLTRTNPIFFPIFIIILIVEVYLGAIFANIYEQFSKVAEFQTSILSLQAINYVMLNLPYFVAILGMIALVVLFAKSRDNVSGGGVEVG